MTLCFQYLPCFEFSARGSILSSSNEETILYSEACAKTPNVMLALRERQDF